MSQWTHVNGSIRVDQFNFGNKETIGLKYEKVLKERFCKNVPKGSEGGLRCDIIATDESGSCNSGPNGEWVIVAYRWVVTIIGDLRDFNDVNAIVNWIKEATKSLAKRSGIIEINVEYQENIVMRWDHDKKWIVTKVKFTDTKRIEGVV